MSNHIFTLVSVMFDKDLKPFNFLLICNPDLSVFDRLIARICQKMSSVGIQPTTGFVNPGTGDPWLLDSEHACIVDPGRIFLACGACVQVS